MKRRKFRCMTIHEHCFNSKLTQCLNCEYRSGIRCQYPDYYSRAKPCKARKGKYVLIEVKD